MEIEPGAEGTEPAEWHLEVQGRRIGPFTASQVIGLYSEGEILADHRASTTPDDPASWITVDQLSRSFNAGVAQADQPVVPAPAEAPKPAPAASPPAGEAEPRGQSLLRQGGAFRPPQRPRHLEPARPAPTGPAPSDPSRELFATFQEAKERKQAKLAPPSTGNWGKRERKKLDLTVYAAKARDLLKKHRVPVLAAAGAFALAGAAFGVWFLFVRNAEEAGQGPSRTVERTATPRPERPPRTEAQAPVERDDEVSAPAPKPTAPPRARKPYAGPGDKEQLGGEEGDEFEKEYGVSDFDDPDGSPIVTPRMRRLQKRLTELQKKGESIENLDDETIQMELMELEDEFEEEIESDFEAPRRDRESE